MQNLTELQKQLCDILQRGLPICEKPFVEIAEVLGTNEKNVLEQIQGLKNAGIIKRFRAIINHRALGKTSTLAAAHVPEEKLQEVAEAVNLLQCVSHNYLRDNFYNLWFTLQAQTISQIDKILSGLSGRFGIDFHSLPVVRSFKLDVRFKFEKKRSEFVPDVKAIPKDEVVVLDADEKLILSKLQSELEITSKPFSFLCDEKLGLEDILQIIIGLVDKGVIRRIAAVLDYRKLGFTANVLFVCEVPQEKIIETGKKLAGSDLVSHCYERGTFENWPYNLFAMMHGRSMDELHKFVDEFVESENIKSYQLLPTVAELKKEPVQYNFQ
jgi:DNA-binding Lrp family transcriptional regulator